MKKIATAYVTTLVAFLAVDLIWLSRMGEMLYRPVMGDMLLDGFRAAPALAFYLIYIGGLIASPCSRLSRRRAWPGRPWTAQHSVSSLTPLTT